MIKSCQNCQFEVNIESSIEWNFCPTCGKPLKEMPLIE